MIDRITEKLNKEIEKILNKKDLNIDEIKFLYEERCRLEMIKSSEESSERLEELSKCIMKFSLKP